MPRTTTEPQPSAAARRFLWSTAVPLAAGAWLLWRVRAPADDPPTSVALSPPGPVASLSVVIPARNEEQALPALLASLAAQTRPADEVIVVDDHSTDRTAVVAAAGGARVLDAPPLPAGWVGKTWACHHGAGAATGDLLAFVDADVTLGPDAVARLLAEHRRHGGLVSVQPAHRTVALHEQLSAVCNVVTMMGTGAFSGPPRRRPDMAFGPFLLLSADDYGAVGGHAHPSVREHVTEDIAIARRMRAVGLPVTLFAGRDTVSFRMYPVGVRQLVAGWTKMIGGGAAVTSPPIALAVAVWVTGALVGAGRGLSVLSAVGRRRWSPSVVLDAAVYGAWAAEMGWCFRRVGRWHRCTAVAFPVPLAAFVVLVARSLVLMIGGRPATWHGRAVPAG